MGVGGHSSHVFPERRFPETRLRRACGWLRKYDVAPTAVGHVRVELGRPEIRVAEHLLDAAQVGSAFQ